jgi:bacterioferritin
MIERMGLHNYIQLNALSEDDTPKSGAAPYLKS